MSKSSSEAPIAWGGSTRTILSMQVRLGLLSHRGVARLENRHRGPALDGQGRVVRVVPAVEFPMSRSLRVSG
jgi:hypothetical protein